MSNPTGINQYTKGGVRAAHKAAKASTAKGTNPYIGRGRSVSRPELRMALAKNLKALRGGSAPSGVVLKDTVRFAAASTAFRNANRKK